MNNYRSISQTISVPPTKTERSATNNLENIQYDLNEFINPENFRMSFIFLKNLLKEAELSKLVASTHTLITDPNTLDKLMKLSNELEHKCTILWLIPQPIDALPEEYKSLSHKLYILTTNNNDVLGYILDISRYYMTVKDLMNALKIDTLPALVIANGIIDIKNPTISNGMILKNGAIDRLIEQKKLDKIIQNIPIWARMSILKDKMKLEAEVKPLLKDIYEKIKPFISFF